MQTTAVRLYGANDLRVERFSLPDLGDDEVLLHVITDSLCTSTYKAVKQGTAHKRVPPDIATRPVIIGHEMCGEIAAVGRSCEKDWHVGQRVVIQPALKLESGRDPGYSYPYIGGSATYAVVPRVVLERGCMIPYAGESFFGGSLVESLGCCLRGFRGFYHTDYTTYCRTDGAKKGGRLAILGGAGPMGIGAAELAIGYAGVAQVVVTDLNEERLAFARRQCPPEEARAHGVDLRYINTGAMDDPVAALREMSDGGFDDVFVMVPVPALFTMAEEICREDGCINFFAGPAVHHLPGALVSHILGLRAVPDAIMAMEKPNGAKKVCYTGLDLPLVAIDDFAERGRTDPLFRELARIVAANGGLWCAEAEAYLLTHAKKLED